MKPKKSLNVCFFSHSAELGGAERTLLELVTELVKDYGVRCTVILPQDGPLKAKLEQAGATTSLINYSWWYDPVFLTDEQVKELCLNSAKNLLYSLKQTLHRINPDIIFTNTMSVPWGAMAASFLQKPHVWFIHEFGEADHGLKTFLPLNDTLKVIKDFSSAILTNSEAVRKTLFPDLKKNKVKTCCQHISIPQAALSQKKRKYFTGKKSTKLMISGTVQEGKGQKDAILAVKELVRRGRDVELVIMGHDTSQYAEHLKALVKREKLKKHIKFIGFKENPYPIINQANIILVCSREEAFGRVTLEGMLLKKPVIATKRGGTLELIQDGFNGLLYEPNDYHQLTDKIEYLMNQPDKAKQFGENGYKFAKKTFTKNNFGGNVYRLLLNLKSQPVPKTSFTNLSLKGPALLDAFLTTANNKDPKITALITELGSLLKIKDTQITEKDTQIAEKDTQIAEKDTQITEKDTQIHNLEFQLQQTQQNIPMQLAKRYHVVMEKALPLATRRRHYYELIITGIRVILNEGLKSFWFKLKYWLIEQKGGRKSNYILYNSADSLPEFYTSSTSETVNCKIKKISFLIGCLEGESKRYRVYNLIEGLTKRGIECCVFYEINVDKLEGVMDCDLLVIFRAAMSPKLNTIIGRFRELNVPIVFDVDDLIFEPGSIYYVRAIQNWPKDTINKHIESFKKYRLTLERCDFVTCTTEFLAKRARSIKKECFVIPNTINRAQYEIAKSIYKNPNKQLKKIKIGYFSGTSTHDKDFLEATSALKKIMKIYKHVELHIIGPLQLSRQLNKFNNRIVKKPFMSYLEMIKYLSQMDINIAPLEQNNPYTAGKSELKIFESALVRVPTVASRVESYSKCILDGVNGFLAGSEKEWVKKLALLIEKRRFKKKMGINAKKDFVDRFYIENTIDDIVKVYEDIMSTYYGKQKVRSQKFRKILKFKGFRILPKAVRTKFYPKVSVIIPNCSHTNYLRQRIESVYRQTYKNIEVILFNNTSDEKSTQIVEEYLLRYPNITRCYFNNKNSGSFFWQREKGIELARGELIWIAENNNYCSENLLEELVRFFTNEAVMLSFCRTVFIDNNTSKQIWSLEEYLSELVNPAIWHQKFIKSAHQLINMAWGVRNIIPNASSVVFRNLKIMSSLKKESWKQMKITGDWIFYLNIIRGGLVGYTPNATNFLRIHKTNTSVVPQKPKTYYYEHKRVVKELIKLYRLQKDTLEKKYHALESNWRLNRPTHSINTLKKCYDYKRITHFSNTRKPNILMVTYALTAGGGEVLPIQLANLLKSAGYGITLLNCHLNTTKLGIRKMLKQNIPLLELDNLDEFNAVVEDLGIEIVHSHHASVDLLVCKQLEHNLDCKVIITMHGMYNLMPPHELATIVPLLNKRVNKFIYVADNNIIPFSSTNIKPDRFTKITNALPDIPIKPISREELGINKECFVLCLVSRAVPEKGWKEGIETVKLARKLSKKEIHLLLIGEGPEFSRLSRQFKDDFIHFLGFKKNTRDYFAASDMGFLPSRFRGESCPLVIIDSLKSGRPVLASNIGEIANMLKVESGQAGAVFQLDNWQIPIKKVAELIKEYATNKVLYNEHCRLTAKAAGKFKPVDMLHCYEEVYREVILKK